MAAKLKGDPLYNTPEELQKAVDGYFEIHVKADGNIPNMEGLTYFLGFANRSEFGRQAERKGFAPTVNKTRSRIADMKLSAAAKGELNATITIFDLVNNHGYVNTRSDNTSKVEHSGSLTVAQAIEAENSKING
jgi:hypothetical protein